MVLLLVSSLFILAIVSFCLMVLNRRHKTRLAEIADANRLLERKIHTILANAPVVFSAIDTNGIFRTSEGKGLEKLGRKANQSVGLSIYEMHNQNPIILNAVKQALSGHLSATTFVLNDVSYDLFVGPEFDAEGKVVGASMLSVDITDRIKIEQEKVLLQIREKTAIETTKLKSEFLATMSHEIRTPLNGVIGMTTLLMDTPLNDQQKEFAEAIKQSGTGLMCVINDILDFSKIEAGKLEFEEIDFNLPELIQHVCKGLKLVASHKPIHFKTEVDPSLQVWVNGDPGRFRQVINNLVSNAIKFTEHGHIIVRASKETDSKRTDQAVVRIEVEDSGIGIPQHSLDKMFHAFSQAEASMARRFGGTGLGLSICRQLVERMGGTIGVQSSEGVGSTFWFVLPFAIGKAPVGDIPYTRANKAFDPRLPAPKVLIAEDNRVNQVITVHMLEKMGCSAVVVADGLKAIEALQTTAFDLVLMDCQMPLLDGLEATRRIRAENAAINLDIPILAMTANAMKGDREKCLAAGMNDYVSKPVAYKELHAAVLRWLEIHRMRKEESA